MNQARPAGKAHFHAAGYSGRKDTGVVALLRPEFDPHERHRRSVALALERTGLASHGL